MFNKVIIGDIRQIKNKKFQMVNPEDYKEAIKKFQVCCEVSGVYQTKPFFDYDKEVEGDIDVEAKEAELKQDIQKILNLDNCDDIYTITRGIREKNGKSCYSFHFSVDNMRISYYNNKKILNGNKTGWDTSVYASNRGLHSLYTDEKLDKEGNIIKVPELLPIGNADITKYLVSYVEEGFKDLDEVYGKITEPKPNKVVNIFKTFTEDIILIKELVKSLNVLRADDREDWLNIGFCLYNINQSEECLEIWEEFSKLSNKYVDGECVKLWNTMKETNMTIGTLKWWSKKDNPALYKEIIDNSVSKSVDIAVKSKGTHYDIAVVCEKLYGDRVIYDEGQKCWYYIDEDTNIWKESKEGNFIIKKLAKDTCKEFMKRCTYYASIDTDDEAMQEINSEKAKMCLKIATQLKNASFQDSIKKQLKSVLGTQKFYETYIDMKIHLFAFKNGVYDLNEKQFRPIEPDDYIMNTCDYNYNENVDEKYMNKILEVLGDIQNEYGKNEYLKDVLSLSLYGKNIHSNFNIFTGVGANGKSVLGNIMDISFGDYFVKVNSDLFTKKSTSNNATSDIANLKGKRLVLFEEPEEDETLQVATLKDLTGDATITARGLYKEPIRFVPQFNIFGNMNDIPKISKVEQAIKRRLKILSFSNKFVAEPKMPNEKLIDVGLNTELSSDIGYRQAFMNILIQNWNTKNLKKELYVPECVKEMTNDYMDDNDFLKDYMEENYEKTSNESDKIKSSNLYNDYKIKMQIKQIKPVTTQSFKNSLINMGYYFKKEKDAFKWCYLKEKVFLEDDE
jgi:P4 family phage/plasmid primase-like protien